MVRRSWICAGLLAAAAAAGTATAYDYDIVIRDGTLIDGTGAAPYRMDVAIKNGRIARIRPAEDTRAAETVDAAGMLVCPGFVELELHPPGEAAAPAVADLLVEGVTSRIRTTGAGGALGADSATSGCAIPQGRITLMATDRRPLWFTPPLAPAAPSPETDLDHGSLGLMAGLQDTAAFDLATRAGRPFIIDPSPDADPLATLEGAIRMARTASSSVVLPLPYAPMSPDHAEAVASALEAVRREKLPLFIAVPQVPGGGYTTLARLLLPRGVGSVDLAGEEARAAIRERLTRFPAESIHPITPEAGVSGLAALSGSWRTTPEEAALRLLQRHPDLTVYCSELISPETYMKLIALPEAFIADSAPRNLRGQEGLSSFPWRYAHMRPLLPIEDAIVKVASLPARALGIAERGRLAPHLPADIVVINPKRSLTPAAPRGYVAYVVASGVLAVKDGVPTGACTTARPLRPEAGGR